jgi:hypothetical protein
LGGERNIKDQLFKGERGATGDHGQRGDKGTTGDPGQKGETGETGDRAKMDRSVVRAFIGMVAVIVFALAVMGYYINETRSVSQQSHTLAEQNHDLIVHVRTLNRQNRSLILNVKTLALEGVKAKRGICSYKQDLRRRTAEAKRAVKTAKAYLREHPNGTSSFSRTLIEASIAQQQNTYKRTRAAFLSLSDLDCSTQ